MSGQPTIGVDLGGTNIRAQVFDPRGKPLGPRIERPSEARKGKAAVVHNICSVVEEVARSSGLTDLHVGMALPGHIDDEAGVVRWATNFVDSPEHVDEPWVNVPLRSLVEAQLKMDLTLTNDANAAAYGEYRQGAGKGTAKCLVLVTLGTGVGGGVVLGPGSLHGGGKLPRLLLGGNKGGVELGQTVVLQNGPCVGTGARGTIEALVGRDPIVSRVARRLYRGEPSLLRELCQGDFSRLHPGMVFEAASEGDRLALQTWLEVGSFLGVAIANFINTFAPDVVAIGGKVSRASKYFWEPMLQNAFDYSVPSLFEFATVVVAEREDDAGLIGAAALAHDHLV